MQTQPPPSDSADQDAVVLLTVHSWSLVLGALFAWNSALVLPYSECSSVRKSSVQTPASPGSFFHHLITNPPASPIWDSGSLVGPRHTRCSATGISWNTPSGPFSCGSFAWAGSPLRSKGSDHVSTMRTPFLLFLIEGPATQTPNYLFQYFTKSIVVIFCASTWVAESFLPCVFI